MRFEFIVDVLLNHNNDYPNSCVFVNVSVNYVIRKYPFHIRFTFICI